MTEGTNAFPARDHHPAHHGTRPAEDTLIDALRGCRDVKELKALEQRLASTTDAPPLIQLDL